MQADEAVWLPVLPSMKGFGPALAKGAGSEADKVGKSTGQRFGKALAVGVVATGAAIATAGVALYKVGEVFDDVTDNIRVGTGATGKNLDALVASAKRVGANVPAEFSAVGTTIADVNTRMGLTGDTLETVASQYLEAGRILGEEVDVTKTSAAFNAFKIEGEDVVGAMDHLFQVSQATGVGMNELADTVSRNAPALQNLGFSFEESAAMVGSFDKAGINSQQVMASLSKGLVTLAKDGEQPQEAFRRVTGEIGGFLEKGDEAGALNLASKVFGTRGATQFVGALQAGTLNLDDMAKAAGQTSDTILGAGEETMDFAEQWQMFKNNVLVWLEPMGARVFGALGTLMGEVTGGVSAFGAAFSDAGTDITSSGVAGFMEATGLALSGIWSILTAGDWNGKLRGAFGWEEDHPFVGFLFGVRDVITEVTGGIEAFAAAWAYNDGQITSSGFPGFMEHLGFAARQVFDYLRNDAMSDLQAFGNFLYENRTAIGIVAGVITALLLPALVRMGIEAMVSAVKSVAAWAMHRTAAATTGAAYVVQSYRIIGTWVAMGLAAVRSGAQTVAIWALYRLEAIKAAGVYVAQRIRIAAQWALMAGAAVASGAKTAAVWTATVVATAVRSAIRFGIQAALVVGGWVLMGAQAMLQGARMAAGWVLAMGPIGWAIAAIVGIAAIVIANWDKIKKWTIDTWNRISGAVRDAWQKYIRPIFQALGDFMRDKVQPVFEKAVDAISRAWKSVANAARKPVNFVIGTVYNNGIRKAYNAVAKVIGLGELGPAKEIPAFAKGGQMRKGWKLVGEQGPEIIDTGPGYVYTAAETKRLLAQGKDLTPAQAQMAAGSGPSSAVAPMGGWWDDAKAGAKWAWDNTVGKGIQWARGNLANAAESVLGPIWQTLSASLPDEGWGGMAKGIGAKAVDGLIDWIRGKDQTSEGSTGAVFDGAPGRFNRPSSGPITSWFGPRWGKRHDGIDFGGSGPARAMWDGLVQKIGWNLLTGRTGIGVLLSHGAGLQSYYGHNPSLGSIPVRVGDRVRGGQTIGRGGSTGNATGDHTHAEVLRNGRAVNFASLLRDTGGTVPPGWNAVFNGTGRDELMLNHQDALQTAEVLRNTGTEGGFHVHGDMVGFDESELMDAFYTKRKQAMLAGGIPI